MKAMQGTTYAGKPHVRFGGKVILGALALAVVHVAAETAAYADLGEFANVNNEFWDTRGHAAVVVACQDALSAPGFDPRGRVSVAAEGEDIDPRGRDFGESNAIRFRSDKPIGIVLNFR